MPRQTPYRSYQRDEVPDDHPHIISFKSTAGLQYGMYDHFLPYPGKWKGEIVAHPAKANMEMLEWIIKTFTKEGDTILDPMSGTGSTGVIAVRNGRNAICAEYEERYVEAFVRPALEEAMAVGSFEAIGKGTAIQCDSRRLTEHLSEAIDTVMFSPPYTNVHTQKKFAGGDEEKDRWAQYWAEHYPERFKNAEEARAHIDKIWLRDRNYGDDPKNIGNLPEGTVDSVITSPPYSNVVRTHAQDVWAGSIRRLEEKGGMDTDFYKAAIKAPSSTMRSAMREGYGKGEDNISNFPHGKIDAVITSPPYSQILSSAAGGPDDEEKVRKILLEKGHSPKQIDKIVSFSSSSAYHLTEDGRGYTDDHKGIDKSNIGNLPHGEIDAVVTSPPYSEALSTKAGGGSKDVLHGRGIIGRGAAGDSPVPYSEDEKQIGNMPHGSIDAVVTSPPYIPEDRRRTISHAEHEERRGFKETGFRSTYGDGKSENYGDPEANVGDPRPYGQVDNVITSPPYEGALEHRGGNQQIGEDKGMSPYTDDPDNIGNMKEETYTQAMYDIYHQCWLALREGGTMVLITKNFCRQKRPVRLDLDTIRLAELAGFYLLERWYFELPDKSFWIIQWTKKYAKRLYIAANPDKITYKGRKFTHPPPINPCAEWIARLGPDGNRMWSEKEVLSAEMVMQDVFDKYQQDFDKWTQKHPRTAKKYQWCFRDDREQGITQVNVKESTIIEWFKRDNHAHPWSDFESIDVFIKPTPWMREMIESCALP